MGKPSVLGPACDANLRLSFEPVRWGCTGGLDKLGIYNRALSAVEIPAIYAEENGSAASN
jgi:hypothetical protein